MKLTAREREILELIAQGKTNQEITSIDLRRAISKMVLGGIFRLWCCWKMGDNSSTRAGQLERMREKGETNG